MKGIVMIEVITLHVRQGFFVISNASVSPYDWAEAVGLFFLITDFTASLLSAGLSAYINYTFPAAGNYSVLVTAENCLSRQVAVIWYKVEIPIVGLDIIPISPIAYGNSSMVYFTISECFFCVVIGAVKTYLVKQIVG